MKRKILGVKVKRKREYRITTIVLLIIGITFTGLGFYLPVSLIGKIYLALGVFVFTMLIFRHIGYLGAEK